VELESLSELATMNDVQLNSYEIISTYIGSNIFDRLSGRWTRVVTLRDPLSRLKSSYWNLRNDPSCMSFASPLARSCGFSDYIASRTNAVIVQSTNVQAWTVLGDRSIAFRQKHADLSDKEVWERSLKQLETYDFIGFTENLSELWQKLCMHFQWPFTQLPILRKSTPFPESGVPSPQDLAFHTALDSELVARARTRYSNRSVDATKSSL
jgi:hypothetical protein